jgi:hypothetical protein
LSDYLTYLALFGTSLLEISPSLLSRRGLFSINLLKR